MSAGGGGVCLVPNMTIWNRILIHFISLWRGLHCHTGGPRLLLVRLLVEIALGIDNLLPWTLWCHARRGTGCGTFGSIFPKVDLFLCIFWSIAFFLGVVKSVWTLACISMWYWVVTSMSPGGASVARPSLVSLNWSFLEPTLVESWISAFNSSRPKTVLVIVACRVRAVNRSGSKLN